MTDRGRERRIKKETAVFCKAGSLCVLGEVEKEEEQ